MFVSFDQTNKKLFVYESEDEQYTTEIDSNVKDLCLVKGKIDDFLFYDKKKTKNCIIFNYFKE
jgi:hypothetical protein